MPKRGRRLVSRCLGAFVLAATEVPDAWRTPTRWRTPRLWQHATHTPFGRRTHGDWHEAEPDTSDVHRMSARILRGHRSTRRACERITQGHEHVTHPRRHAHPVAQPARSVHPARPGATQSGRASPSRRSTKRPSRAATSRAPRGASNAPTSKVTSAAFGNRVSATPDWRQPFSIFLTESSSRPFRPMTTSRVHRSSPARQSRS